MKFEDLEVEKSRKVKELRITGRMENENEANTHYRLSGGSIITRELAVLMHDEEGFLKDYKIILREGELYLRGKRDSDDKNNIDKQPLIKSVKIETDTGFESL